MLVCLVVPLTGTFIWASPESQEAIKIELPIAHGTEREVSESGAEVAWQVSSHHTLFHVRTS